jgi:pyruvate/2-oxoglutarate dehydrogenase complex dihydrolipoamide dehydrogenase (E3) component
LLKAAKIAHQIRTASIYGINSSAPVTDMSKVRDYVRRAIEGVYQSESPEELKKQNIDVVKGTARFIDGNTVAVGDDTVRAKTFLVTTGARPAPSGVEGIQSVPHVTYEQIFDNDQLPRRMIVIGGGPIGVEIAQAYQRFGSQVTVIATMLLPREDPEASAVIERVFESEGIQRVRERAISARMNGSEIVVTTRAGEVRGDSLLLATGRKPNVEGLNLERAGVRYSAQGIPVDAQLRTNVPHIYAAGDVLGGRQFTHLAGWQAFQAVRNALLPGHSSGFTDVVPSVTFTDPEVAHIGLTEEQVRKTLGDEARVSRWTMTHTDRAICENDLQGFIKVIAGPDGSLLGATIVAARAGEAITEFVLALQHKWKVSDLAGTIHAYPTYSSAVQQLAAEVAIQNLLAGTSGRLLLGLSKFIR